MTADATSSLFKLSPKQKRTLSLSLILAAGFYLSYALFIGYDDLLAALTTLGPLGALFLLACSFVNYLIRFFRWHVFIDRLGHRLPYRLHFQYYLAGFALTTTPAKAGETIRSVYLKSHDVNISHSLASFFCERFLDVIVISLLASLVIMDFSQYRQFVIVVALVLIVLLVILRNDRLHLLFNHLATKIKLNIIHRPLLYLSVLFHKARQLLQPQPLLLGFTAGLLAWTVQGIAFYYLIDIFNNDLSFTTAIAIYAISLLAGALSFIPGGIGATEAVMYLMLSQSGVASEQALIIPLINRITTLWFAVVLGLLASTHLSLKK